MSIERINKFLYLGGIIIAIISIFIITPLMFFFTKYIQADFEKYEYTKIISNGYKAKAKLTKIIIRDNISINDINPRIVLYTYNSGNLISDKFQTLDYEKVNHLQSLDSIDICVYNNQSVIIGLKPYKLSIRVFWVIPVFMVFFGISMIVVSKSLVLQRFTLSKK